METKRATRRLFHTALGFFFFFFIVIAQRFMPPFIPLRLRQSVVGGGASS